MISPCVSCVSLLYEISISPPSLTHTHTQNTTLRWYSSSPNRAALSVSNKAVHYAAVTEIVNRQCFTWEAVLSSDGANSRFSHVHYLEDDIHFLITSFLISNFLFPRSYFQSNPHFFPLCRKAGWSLGTRLVENL